MVAHLRSGPVTMILSRFYAAIASVAAVLAASQAAGHAAGMTFNAPSVADSDRFLAVYNEVAERNARRATRYEIDALRSFHYARRPRRL